MRWTYSWYASPSGLGEPPDRYGMGVWALSGRTERSDPHPHIYSPTSVGSKSCTQWFRVSQMILREQISMGLSARWAISHTKWAVFLDKKAGRNGLGQNSWRLACWRPTGDKRLGRWCGRGCHPDRQEDFPPPRGLSPGVPEAQGAPGISTG